MTTFELPIRTVNGANERVHWSKKASRARAERVAAFLVCPRHLAIPCSVTLTRRAPRAFDSDGLVISFKAIRDGIADRLGVNDGDPRVTWSYAQERAKTYSVKVEIT